MTKRALIVGIDHYDTLSPLPNCIDDATRVEKLLGTHEDGRGNFSTKLMTSENNITRQELLQALKISFGSSADMVLFYFSGHAQTDKDTSIGQIFTSDGNHVSLQEIINLANKGHQDHKIKSSVIILDCCQSGSVGDQMDGNSAIIGSGMTILTAANREQEAKSGHEGSVFTNLLIDALEGGASDIRGRITPAAIYSHIDQALNAWSQRPLYKANVHEFICLREIKAKIPDATLLNLPTWFPEYGHHLSLNPSFEPDIKAGTETDYPEDIREKNQAIFAQLQLCNRFGLVEPVDAEHMYYAAMKHKSCRLTRLGEHYRRLAIEGLIR